MTAYPVSPLPSVRAAAGRILRNSLVDLDRNEANILTIVRDGTYCASTTLARAGRLIDQFIG
jgi:hypothetical protein